MDTSHLDDGRPWLLDLCCCQGGASRGYVDAGFRVVGVDVARQRRYPFPFLQADVLDVLDRLLAGERLRFDHPLSPPVDLALEDFAAIHASPPCQAYSITRHGHSKPYPRLIEPIRDRLQRSGKPWVMENVKGAPLLEPATLCWTMFHEPGSVLDDDDTPLQMFRHRLFEVGGFDLQPPRDCRHVSGMQVAGSYGGARRDKVEARTIRHGGYVPSAAVQQQLLGIDWTTQRGMHESIPPVYAEHVGRQLLASL